MAEMTRAQVRDLLIEDGVKADLAALYADAFVEFREAVANIEKNGAVCANPRTGAPMDNPYCKVRDKAAERLRRLRGAARRWLWEGK